MTEQARTRPVTDTPDVEPTQRRLERVLAEVRADAQLHPEAYARETVVPEGGE